MKQGGVLIMNCPNKRPKTNGIKLVEMGYEGQWSINNWVNWAFF